MYRLFALIATVAAAILAVADSLPDRASAQHTR